MHQEHALSCHTSLPPTSTDLQHPDGHSLWASPSVWTSESLKSISLHPQMGSGHKWHITLSGISLYKITNTCASVVPVTTAMQVRKSQLAKPKQDERLKALKERGEHHSSTKHLPCIRLRTKHITWINSLKLHTNPLGWHFSPFALLTFGARSLSVMGAVLSTAGCPGAPRPLPTRHH